MSTEDTYYLLKKHREAVQHYTEKLFKILDAPLPVPETDKSLLVDFARSACSILLDVLRSASPPIPMILFCPARECGQRHIDKGPWADRHHHTHSCQHCGLTWRPAVVNTVGVQFLPGFKNEDSDDD